MKSQVSLLLASILTLSAVAPSVYANNSKEAFTAESISVLGLKRISAETFYANISFSDGDTVSAAKTAQSIKQLYSTGYFSDIKAVRSGNKLIFTVTESPVITSVEIKGKPFMPKPMLLKALSGMGVRKGEPLRAEVLDKVEKDLESQLLSQGQYSAKVVFDKIKKPNNTVDLTIKFYEASAAKVVDITILGNKHFTTQKITDTFVLNETNLLSFLNKKNNFSQPKLAKSLQNVEELYLNKGFFDFKIQDTLVNISEDKKKVFLEISVNEGKQYSFGKTTFMGNPKYTDKKLLALTNIETDTVFSKKSIAKATQSLQQLYGNAGYFFAKVRPIPKVNEETQKVDVDFFIDPGKPIYVRRINFQGNIKTADDVLRHEMRQLEGAIASNEKISLSKQRLERTGFFKLVKLQTQRVQGSHDKIDINITVEEQASGSTSLAAGYSQEGGISFQAGLSQSNFFGTGNAVNIQLSRSDTADNYSISTTNPYFTVDGVSQSVDVFYKKTKVDEKNINNYVTDSLGARLQYGYPVDENTRLSAGVGVSQTNIKAGENIAIANLDYMLKNGVTVSRTQPTKTAPGLPNQLNEAKLFEADYTSYNVNFAWSRNTLDRPLFPNKGMSHRLSADIGVPGSDTSYQKITYNGNIYQPLGLGFIARGYTKLGYGNDLPFYKNYTAGGFGTLRGYESGRLGPTSQTFSDVRGALSGGQASTNPSLQYVGGNALAQAGMELVIPIPSEADWTKKIRTVMFAEGAQVFDTLGRDKEKFEGTSVPMLTQDNEMRYTAGLSTTLISPIGPISFSYSKPLNKKDGDQTQKFQFDIGRVF